MGKLTGKVAIITGATSGIGKATALLFAEEGADLVITGRRAELGKAVEAEISQKGVRCVFVQADHSKADDCSRVVEQTLASFGRVDILFNNAGIVTSGTAETTSDEVWDETLAVNVTAVWRMSKLVIPHMKKQGDPHDAGAGPHGAGTGGVIVNNGSDWSVVGGRDAFLSRLVVFSENITSYGNFHREHNCKLYMFRMHSRGPLNGISKP